MHSVAEKVTAFVTRATAQAKRPSRLYQFDEKKYRTMTLRGYDFVF
jgi:hypothetical protein